MTGGSAIVRAVSLAALLVCCTACPYEDIVLSGHKARAYDVKGYMPHVPETSSALRQQSKTIYTKYPVANYKDHQNLRNTNLRGPNHQGVSSRLSPHLVRQRQYGKYMGMAPARTVVPQHLVQRQRPHPINRGHGGRGRPTRYQPRQAIHQGIPQLAARGPIIEEESSYTPQAIHQTKKMPHVKSRYYEYIDELNSEFDD